jgi:cobalt transporter subunit CbtA
MIARALLAAVLVGLFSGLAATGVQYWRVVPLIIAAEAFEGDMPVAHDHGALTVPGSALPELFQAIDPVGAANAHADHGGEKTSAIERLGGTVLANLVTGAGFALLLLAARIFAARPLDAGNAAAWAACGWLAVHFLPALGLPPELPGFPAAPLADRQIWWAATVAASVAGLFLIFTRQGAARLGGVALIALPHVFGAPQPTDIASNVPALYAAEYAVAALAASLVFWLLLAFGLAWALKRIGFDSETASP